MAGISSKAAGKLENKKDKFQGQEYIDDLGVNMYEFKYRMDDPQTGKFWQVDPLADKYVHNSTYAFSENKVTGHVELEGLESASINDIKSPLIRAAVKENVQQNVRSFNKNLSEAVEVKVSAGVGVGVGVKVGKTDFSVGVSGPQGEITMNGSGQTSAKVSASDAHGKIETPFGEGKANVAVGVTEFKDGKMSANYVTMGADGQLNFSKENSQRNISQKLEGGSSGDVGLSGKLGAIGGEIKVNLMKAGSAVVDFFKGGIELMKNMVSDKVKTSSTTDKKPPY